MKKMVKSIVELIGNTPMVEVSRFAANNGVDANLIAKLEYFNPAGSVKDRIALSMVEETERQGKLKPGMEIIEPTSGNTGIGLALVATVKGYKLTLTMPETMSMERRNLLRARGANIVLTEGSKGMSGAVAKAKELQEANKDSI
ncbi:MAG: pyridoxal-phosphate dependent enzyme, partial [Bacteroidales bacterium]|nr:pyridoxal-phosphate dependent enzyme [Bacteroidales bacterium]